MVKISAECIACLFQLALRCARAATTDETTHRQVLVRLAEEIPRLPDDAIPARVGQRVQRIVHELTGVEDPYRAVRRRSNEQALALYPRLKRLVAEAQDPLLLAVRLAIAGNVVDLAVGSGFDLERGIEESLESDFAICDYELFSALVDAARSVLYIGDNAGEIVLDRLLLEELLSRGKKATLAVRGGPAINDAVLDDAYQAGMTSAVEVITTGSDLPSVVPQECGPGFRSHYRSADLVISKGQGNFEGLCDAAGPVAFLLKAKCSPVARRLQVARDSLVLRCNTPSSGEGAA